MTWAARFLSCDAGAGSRATGKGQDERLWTLGRGLEGSTRTALNEGVGEVMVSLRAAGWWPFILQE
jgi:hypothetical protein